jgi:uncharacterized protein YbaR (Trm112 family)
MDTRLIELLVCPVCKGPLRRSDDGHALNCNADRLAFPIRDGIPVMLESEALALEPPAEFNPAQQQQPTKRPTPAAPTDGSIA